MARSRTRSQAHSSSGKRQSPGQHSAGQPSHEEHTGERQQDWQGSDTRGACSRTLNVGGDERIASLVAGSLIGLYGLTRGSLPGLALTAIGGSLIYRGLSGHCMAYESLGIDTSDANQSGRQCDRMSRD